MKYFVFAVFIIIFLLSFSKTPTHKIVAKDILFSRDTIVPKRATDSLHYKLGNRWVSEREIDSVIWKVAKETIQLARKKGYVDTTKKQ